MLNVSVIMSVILAILYIFYNPYLLFQVLSGHNSITVKNRAHVFMFFFVRRPRLSSPTFMSTTYEISV